MEIVSTKRLKDGLNFVIEYMEDGQLHCLFISAEKIVKYYKAAQQSLVLDVDSCDCGEPFPENGYCQFCYTHRR